MILAIKFLKDCEDYDYASSCDREICDLSVNSQVETIALVCEDTKKIYDYGAGISLSDNFNHHFYVSNSSSNGFIIHFWQVYLGEYSDIKSLSAFFNAFVQELWKK